MFGTIGRARTNPGAEDAFVQMQDDWLKDVRPKIPGRFIELVGRSTQHPDEVLFIALAQDEQTYRALAEMPEQHAFYERMMENVDGEIRWEDVELDVRSFD